MRKLLTGNEAIVEAARLIEFDFVAAYPITPSTSIIEGLARLAGEGGNSLRFKTMESEFSVMAACMGAASAGVDAFTATSSHGLAYMHELLHWVAGARLPIVMAVVNRAIGYPWNIHADESDSLSQRDTGWMQFYCENSQDALDFLIMARRLAKDVRLPAMVCLDGFYVSHTSETVEAPNAIKVRRFLRDENSDQLEAGHNQLEVGYDVSRVRNRPDLNSVARMKTKMSLRLLDTKAPASFGNPVSSEDYVRYRQEHARAFELALTAMARIDEDFLRLFKRHVEPLVLEMMHDAETAVVSMGSACTSARAAVKAMRENGGKVGFIKINAFRPFPAQMLADSTSHLKEIVVIERDMSPGTGGILAQEIRAALSALRVNVEVTSAPMGIGGEDISKDDVIGAASLKLDTTNLKLDTMVSPE